VLFIKEDTYLWMSLDDRLPPRPMGLFSIGPEELIFDR
jgi:hypothetical protein